MSNVKRGLFWFRHDLRLSDNPALNALCDQCEEVIFVYIFDSEWLTKTQFGTTRLGLPRWQFIQESLDDLNQQLAQHQQKLIIRVGEPSEVITELIQENSIDAIGVTPHSGFYETQAVKAIKTKFGDALEWQTHESFTLFNQSQLPFELNDLPDGFSPFRKKIEKAIKPKHLIEKVVQKPTMFPSIIADIESDPLPDFGEFTNPFENMVHKGGEQAAQQQLNFYTHQSKHLSQYKETRNGLDGWDFSSKLSAYLALGCVSPKQVMQTVLKYEKQNGSNQSSYWLYFELLWREFYQWHQALYQRDLYLERGIQDIDPQLGFNKKAFEQWRDGETKNDFVNAFMRQLKLTGWMSNRGRQIVASYFVNELGLDWRYGAAWFEEQLIDYDAGSNWGNWQYLAGVGVDPRGRRAFNIEKQRQTYDPEKQFIHRYS